MSGDLPYVATFIEARLAEDRATADGLMFACRNPDLEPDFFGCGGPCAEEFWKRFDPPRMLRDIEAKRTAVAACLRAAESDPNSPAGVLALAVLDAVCLEWEHEDRPFVPDWTLCPGVLVRETMKARGMTADDLSARTFLRPEAVAGILSGQLRIAGPTARLLAGAFGTSADMWLNAQRIHDAALLRGATDSSEEAAGG